MQELTAVCRILGEVARLRILRLLARERLNVSELTAILGLAQSGVSRHLGLLRDAGLIEESRAAGYTWYRATRAPHTADVWALLDSRFANADHDPAARADGARLLEVLRERKERFAAQAAEGRPLVPGRSWAAWARALGLLLPPLDAGDLGCGEGYLTIEMARWARHVTAVDRSAAALGQARALADRRGAKNITWKRGDLEALPLPDASLDVTMLSQALHHAARPDRALAEAVRVTRPGGRVLVLDLRTHDQAWLRDLGDRWLGFDDDALARMMSEAGLTAVRVELGARLRGDPFTVLVAAGEKRPAAAGRDGLEPHPREIGSPRRRPGHAASR